VQKVVDVVLGSEAITNLAVQHTLESMGVPAQPVGATPNVAATPSGQVTSTPGGMVGNPEQQQATQLVGAATAAP
jgi:hypothetical protein